MSDNESDKQLDEEIPKNLSVNVQEEQDSDIQKSGENDVASAVESQEEAETVMVLAEIKPRMTMLERREALKKAAEERKKKKQEKGRNEPKDEIEEALFSSKIKKKQDQKRKKTFQKVGTLFAACVLGYGIYLLFKPFKATMSFGVCKVFLETNVRFPETLRLSTVDEVGNYTRIWYTQIDAFGQYRMENIQCYFEPDEKMGARVEKILINRREIDPQRVADFNRILPVVFAYPPDLTWPAPIPDSLEDVQIDADKFRTPLF